MVSLCRWWAYIFYLTSVWCEADWMSSVVTASSPLVIHHGGRQAVAAVVGFNMKYSTFYQHFVNVTTFCGRTPSDDNCNFTCRSPVSYVRRHLLLYFVILDQRRNLRVGKMLSFKFRVDRLWAFRDIANWKRLPRNSWGADRHTDRARQFTTRCVIWRAKTKLARHEPTDGGTGKTRSTAYQDCRTISLCLYSVFYCCFWQEINCFLLDNNAFVLVSDNPDEVCDSVPQICY